MKTVIISSSLSKNSKSFILGNEVNQKLKDLGFRSEVIDARSISLNAYHLTQSNELDDLSNKISKADNLIIAMGVHNFSINDSLKIILDTCFKNVEGKFFGILCAAGGEKSYLSTMHLTQICMNEWRMIQLPRIIYATKKDFENNKLTSKNIKERIDVFCNEFIEIGQKIMS
jgi:FMN reductase